MIKKSSILDFFRDIIEVFGITIISISLIVLIFGNNAKEISSIFRFGNEGIAIGTLLQFLALSVILTALKWIFLTDKIIKKGAIATRFICMLICIVAIVGIIATIFKWFPINMILPWIMFLLSFAICTTISALIFKAKEKNENERLQDALEKLKKERE